MKKQILTIGTLAATIAPIAAVVSCGDDSTDPNAVFKTNVVVAANKEWVSTYTQIANEFNKAHPNNAYKILIKEQTDSDIAWDKKGITDPSIPDVFTVDNPKAIEMAHQHYLSPFPGVTNEASFEHKYVPGHHFTNWDITNKVNRNGKVYAVPFNTEAQLAVEYGATPPATDANGYGPSATDTTRFDIAAPQELFKVAGIGQTDADHGTDSLFNLIQGTQNQTTHKYTYTANLNTQANGSGTTPSDALYRVYDKLVKPLYEAKHGGHLGAATSKANKAYENLFASGENGFMTMIGGQENLFMEAVNSAPSAGDHDDTLNKHLTSTNKTPRLYLGTWRVNDLIKKFHDAANLDETKLNFYAPKDYHQWKGGWTYVMNKRVTGEKAQIAADFIGELLKPSHANAMFNATSKPSPLDNITWNTGDANKDKINNLIGKASAIGMAREAVTTVADDASFGYWGTPTQDPTKVVSWAAWSGAIKTSLDTKINELNN